MRFSIATGLEGLLEKVAILSPARNWNVIPNALHAHTPESLATGAAKRPNNLRPLPQAEPVAAPAPELTAPSKGPGAAGNPISLRTFMVGNAPQRPQPVAPQPAAAPHPAAPTPTGQAAAQAAAATPTSIDAWNASKQPGRDAFHARLQAAAANPVSSAHGVFGNAGAPLAAPPQTGPAPGTGHISAQAAAPAPHPAAAPVAPRPTAPVPQAGPPPGTGPAVAQAAAPSPTAAHAAPATPPTTQTGPAPGTGPVSAQAAVPSKGKGKGKDKGFQRRENLADQVAEGTGSTGEGAAADYRGQGRKPATQTGPAPGTGVTGAAANAPTPTPQEGPATGTGPDAAQNALTQPPMSKKEYRRQQKQQAKADKHEAKRKRRAGEAFGKENPDMDPAALAKMSPEAKRQAMGLAPTPEAETAGFRDREHERFLQSPAFANQHNDVQGPQQPQQPGMFSGWRGPVAAVGIGAAGALGYGAWRQHEDDKRRDNLVYAPMTGLG